MKFSSTVLVLFCPLVLAWLALHCSHGNSADGGVNDRQEEFETSEGILIEVDLGPNDCEFESMAYKPLGELIQVISQDGADCVKMKRKVKEGVGPGGFTTGFEPVSLTIGHGGEVIELTDPQALAYDVTLHNWYDTMDGTSSGILYHFAMSIDNNDWNTFHYQISASNVADAKVLWGPVDVYPVNL